MVWRPSVSHISARDPNLGYAVGTPGLYARLVVAVVCPTRRCDGQDHPCPESQCAWLLLLYCSAARANHHLRVVHPDLSSTFAAHHGASLRRVLGWTPVSCSGTQQVRRCTSEVWVCEVPVCRPEQPTGPVGLTVHRWCNRGTPLCHFAEPPRADFLMLRMFVPCKVAPGFRPVRDHGTRSTSPWLADGRHMNLFMVTTSSLPIAGRSSGRHPPQLFPNVSAGSV